MPKQEGPNTPEISPEGQPLSKDRRRALRDAAKGRSGKERQRPSEPMPEDSQAEKPPITKESLKEEILSAESPHAAEEWYEISKDEAGMTREEFTALLLERLPGDILAAETIPQAEECFQIGQRYGMTREAYMDIVRQKPGFNEFVRVTLGHATSVQEILEMSDYASPAGINKEFFRAFIDSYRKANSVADEELKAEFTDAIHNAPTSQKAAEYFQIAQIYGISEEDFREIMRERHRAREETAAEAADRIKRADREAAKTRGIIEGAPAEPEEPETPEIRPAKAVLPEPVAPTEAVTASEEPASIRAARDILTEQFARSQHILSKLNKVARSPEPLPALRQAIIEDAPLREDSKAREISRAPEEEVQKAISEYRSRVRTFKSILIEIMRLPNPRLGMREWIREYRDIEHNLALRGILRQIQRREIAIVARERLGTYREMDPTLRRILDTFYERRYRREKERRESREELETAVRLIRPKRQDAGQEERKLTEFEQRIQLWVTSIREEMKASPERKGEILREWETKIGDARVVQEFMRRLEEMERAEKRNELLENKRVAEEAIKRRLEGTDAEMGVKWELISFAARELKQKETIPLPDDLIQRIRAILNSISSLPKID